ncbi:MAG: hypothetical protein P4L61_03605, partial [Candidatus Pacebacteria bacterium]|nr:hypothetical protein [Candidatus Paceibacterota bacterium]
MTSINRIFWVRPWDTFTPCIQQVASRILQESVDGHFNFRAQGNVGKIVLADGIAVSSPRAWQRATDCRIAPAGDKPFDLLWRRAHGGGALGF